MKNNFPTSPVAYFVLEYALDSAVQTYAGGLGVLAADFLLEAAQENFPFVLVSLRYSCFDASKSGYALATDAAGNPIVLRVPIEKKEIAVRAWVKIFGGSTAALLLDTDVAENTPEDRNMCEKLYDPHLYARIRQSLVLGLAGVEFLHVLGASPRVYHINEGNSSLAIFGIIADKLKQGRSFEEAVELTKAETVFTKHTILSEAGLYIPSHDFFTFIEGYATKYALDPKKIFNLAKYEKDEDVFSTTKFGIELSCRRNGVSKIHAVKEKERYPSSDLTYVTNGIFKNRWRVLPASPGMSDETLWQGKAKARADMIDFVSRKSGALLKSDVLTVVWARRFAGYKRPKLLFSDLARLKSIVSDAARPVQIIISGKAHPTDEEGQKTVEMIRSIAASEDFRGKLAYVPDYSLEIASHLVAGADVWLNTPLRGYEACGTSGMKAGLNGALMCSISDGWMDEVDWQGIGWVLPEEKTADTLYDFLEKEIIPAFYTRTEKDLPNEWLERMKKTIAIIDSNYGADRMLKDYCEKMYGFGA